MKFSRAFVLSLLTTVFLANTMSAEPIRILPVGDSITQGGKADRQEYTYRWPLFMKLVDAGVDFDFVGSRTAGLQPDAKWPADYKGRPFDADHEGYYGGQTAYVRDKIKANINSFAVPDIALVQLGQNNQHSKDYQADIVEPLTDLIRILRERNPKMVILVGHLLFNGGKALTIRPLMDKVCTDLNTAESPVIAVNHFEGWKEKPDDPDTDTFDWTHPNPKGQEKMAANWLTAMKPYLKLK